MTTNEPEETIDLVEAIDLSTHETVYAAPDAPGTISHGTLTVAGAQVEPQAVKLTDERFAADEDEFAAAERAQSAGKEAKIVNGQLVFGDSSDNGQGVKLTNERFAAVGTVEADEIVKLARSGAAAAYVQTLMPTGQMRKLFPQDPGGVYLHTKPTRHGDELHVVIVRDASTGLYHAHLWAFMMREGGGLNHLNLDKWVGADPTLSAHHTHLYPGSGGHGAVLCLSERTRGGIESLSTCVVRCAQWANGMGDVVRGAKFPYRE